MQAHLLPKTIKDYQQKCGLNYNNLMSTNPKTDKNKLPTNLLHLAPSNISGFNVCKFAGNCKKICLHFSGNPAYFSNKFQSRINKTLSFNRDKDMFIKLLILNICRNYKKNFYTKIGIRLNGTSDILWEKINVFIDKSTSNFIHRRFDIDIRPGSYSNIFNVFLENDIYLKFYDYTKNIVDRDLKECTKSNYHLTFSFDGYSNKKNVEHCKMALESGLNVAAAINIKRGRKLPERLSAFDRVMKTFDGDISDERFNDPANRLILIRVKNPLGTEITAKDVERFCIA